MATLTTSGAVRRVKQAVVRDRVRDALLLDITSQRRPVGAKLESIDRLARSFNASTFPVREALSELEAKGYVVSKHGSGTYVTANHPPLTVADSVMLCMEAHAHVYGELSVLLLGRLMGQGFLPGVVDLSITDCDLPLLHRALASSARFFVIHGRRYFDFQPLARAALPNRHFIGVINWNTDLDIPNVHRILADSAAGGRLVAQYLFDRGHRHVLVLGTDTMINSIKMCFEKYGTDGSGFVEAWEALGGTWESMCSTVVEGAEIKLAEKELLDHFRGAKVPTAIFGLRDVEAWHAQSILLKRMPIMAASLEVVGFGNTPWSQAGHPPFTTVDLNIEEIADRTLERLLALRSGQDVDVQAPVMVAPRMVVR